MRKKNGPRGGRRFRETERPTVTPTSGAAQAVERKKRKGIVLVHGIGNQKPLDFLREFTAALCAWINWCSGYNQCPQLVARLDSMREPTAERGGEADILVGNFRIRIYEVYWADLGQAPESGLLKTLRFSTWIIHALVRPAALTLNANRKECPVGGWTAFKSLLLLVPAFVFFLLDLLTIASRFVKRLSGIAVSIQRTLMAYAGDIRVYTSENKQVFGREVKDVIVDRFRQTLSRAHEANESIVVVGHSLGSVVAYDGLTKDDYRNPTDGTPLQPWPPTRGCPPLEKVVALFTLGSPLDKFNYFWPDRISMTPVGNGGQKKIWWGNFQEFLDPVGANLNAYTRENWQRPYPCRGSYCLDTVFDGPNEYRLCIAYSPGRAHFIYWWTREFMSALIDQLGLEGLSPPRLRKGRLKRVALTLRDAFGKAAKLLPPQGRLMKRVAPVLQGAFGRAATVLKISSVQPPPREPKIAPMVYRCGFWSVIALGAVLLIKTIWTSWLRPLYLSKLHPLLLKGAASAGLAADALLSWSGVEQRGWGGFISQDIYTLFSLMLSLILLLGVFLCMRYWTWKDMVAGVLGLILFALLTITLGGLGLGVSVMIPYLAVSMWISGAVGAFAVTLISWIAIRTFLNRPLRKEEAVQIVLNVVVFSVMVFLGILIAARAWLSLVKLFATSPTRTISAILLCGIFLVLVASVARLRRELARSSVERIGDAFY